MAPQNRAGPPNRNNISRPAIPNEICKTMRFTLPSEHNLRCLFFRAAAIPEGPIQSHSFQDHRPSSLECSLSFDGWQKESEPWTKKGGPAGPCTGAPHAGGSATAPRRRLPVAAATSGNHVGHLSCVCRGGYDAAGPRGRAVPRGGNYADVTDHARRIRRGQRSRARRSPAMIAAPPSATHPLAAGR